jgi:hypothetical protein
MYGSWSQVASETALSYRSGMPVIALCWVLIRAPLGLFEAQALLCTDVHATPAFILDGFVQRWQMEVIFEEARAHPSVETQRQWSDKAAARATPCLLSLYSIVTLLVQPLFAKDSFLYGARPGMPNHRPPSSTQSHPCVVGYGARNIFKTRCTSLI